MLRTIWWPLAPATRFGVAVAGVGILVDFIHHTFTHDLHAVEALNIGGVGHIVTLAGMVLAMSGVIHAAVESRRRDARQKGENDAARRSSAAAR